METEERLIKLYGTPKAPVQFRMLRAGALEARLENGNLRYVRFQGHEVLRAISFVIRDRDWGTCQPLLENLSIDEQPDRFDVSYEGSCGSGSAVLRYRAEITGDAEGNLRFSAEAQPEGDFLTNRCGFTVLHPIEGVAGAPVTVEHPDGSMDEAAFPEFIDPWQPFKNIRALTHTVAGLFTAHCRFEGATFEMEDHRNWSDASFKTYVRPLELPWPYLMRSGEIERSAIALSVRPLGTPAALPESASLFDPDDIVTLSVIEVDGVGHHPQIGLVVAPEEIEAATAHLDLLNAAGPQVVLCHYDPTAGHGIEALSAFAGLQRQFPARYILECVIVGTGDPRAELSGVADGISRAGLDLAALAVCPSVDRQSTPPGSAWPPCLPLAEIYGAARAAFPGLPLGGGMFSYFTELNRKRPPVERLDFVTHATNPIVHAADDESVMETLESLPHIVRSARRIIGEKPYHIGPSTIAMRQNPYGSSTFDNPQGDRMCMANTDPRHFGLFGAAWTIGYADKISGGPTLYVPASFAGPRGLLSQSNTQERGQVNPLFHSVRLLAGLAGAEILPCKTSIPHVAALAARRSGGIILIIANLSNRSIRIAPPRSAGGSFEFADVLDAAGYEVATGRWAFHRYRLKGTGILLDAFAVAVLGDGAVNGG
jgi:D-apionolactonase